MVADMSYGAASISWGTAWLKEGAPLQRATCINILAAYLKLEYDTYPLRSITYQQRGVSFRNERHNKLRGGAFQLMGSMYKLKDSVYQMKDRNYWLSGVSYHPVAISISMCSTSF